MEENEFMEPSFGEIMGLIQQYEEAVKSRRGLYFEEESYEQIIQFYFDNREFNKSLRVVESALEQYPFSSFFHTKRAELLANAKRFEEAIQELETAENLDPNDINIFLIRADVNLWQGKHEDAMKDVELGLSISDDPDDKCELYLELADIWEDQEKYWEVMEALKNALYADPENEEALNRFWFCTELTGKYEESIEFHEALIELSPYSYLAWYNLGHAFAGVGLLEKSIEAFDYVIAIDENFDPAYVCVADVLYNLERYNEAMVFYQDAIKLSKPNKELYLKTAECFEKLGELTKSRTYLRKAIGVDPYYDEAFFRIGETYRIEEEWPKAISSFERAVKLNKENIDYLAALAEAYLSIEDNTKALEVFERIFQVDPQTKLNWINLATAYFNVENYRKAFQVLTEAEHKYESSADIYYIKSVFYFQVGNRHEAIINLERGLLLNFNEHTLVFEMDDSLLDDHAVIMAIDQYRPE
jgi:tetratricopeptide (TPR) repeat protein